MAVSPNPPYKAMIQHIDYGEIIWGTQEHLFEIPKDPIMNSCCQIIQTRFDELDSEGDDDKLKVRVWFLWEDNNLSNF